MKIRECLKRKLIISIIIVMLTSFFLAKTVCAKTFLETAGGKLLKPVLNFTMFIGDTVENALHNSMYRNGEKAIVTRTVAYTNDVKAAMNTLNKLSSIAKYLIDNNISTEYILPDLVDKYGENFPNKEGTKEYAKKIGHLIDSGLDWVTDRKIEFDLDRYSFIYTDLPPNTIMNLYDLFYLISYIEDPENPNQFALSDKVKAGIVELLKEGADGTYDLTKTVMDFFRLLDERLEKKGEEEDIDQVIELEPITTKLDLNILTPDMIDIPNGVIYSPYEIFSNKIPLMDVNFFSPNKYVQKRTYFNTVNADDRKVEIVEEEKESVASMLRGIVSKWYVALRNIAIVVLLSILLYIGIRIVISSSAEDKAAYKKMLLDWLVALCLVFCMHYIMTLSVTLVEKISEIMGKGVNTYLKIPINVDSALTGRETDNFTVTTNLTGYIRLVAGICNSAEATSKAVEYVILYLIIVAYTVMFTIIYLKRVIYMAFLTVIAPITAITYPLRRQKANGGQAFSIWLKEYLTNLIIQPLHLLVYSLVLGSTMTLAVDHPVYAVVAFACLIPAEKILFEILGLRTPRYADTERTMNTEKSAVRFAAHTAGRVINGAIRGAKTIGTTIALGVTGGAAGAAGGAAAGGAEAGAADAATTGTEANVASGTGDMQLPSGNIRSSRSNSSPKYESSRNSSGGRNQVNNTNVTNNVTNNNEFNIEQNVNEAVVNRERNTKNINGEITRETDEEMKEKIDAITKGEIIDSIFEQRYEENPHENKEKQSINVGNINMELDQTTAEIYPEYEKAGITSPEEFKAIYAVEQSGISREEAIATYAIAQETGDIRGNADLTEKWQNELSERLTQTKEIRQLMETQGNAVLTKYQEIEKEEKKKLKKSSKNDDYEELQRKIDKLGEDIKKKRDKEMEEVKNIPIKYANKIIDQIGQYYDNLD